MSLLKMRGTELRPRQYFGKYRGTVVSNADSLNMARIIAIVPDVSNVALTSWAMPSLPWCGPQMGMVCIPPIGAGVWIEFEQGDPDYPIWTGCFWGSASEVPAAARSVPPSAGITFQTLTQNVLQLSDTGITLRTKLATVEITDGQISVEHLPLGRIVIKPDSVDINGGALQIT